MNNKYHQVGLQTTSMVTVNKVKRMLKRRELIAPPWTWKPIFVNKVKSANKVGKVDKVNNKKMFKRQVFNTWWPPPLATKPLSAWTIMKNRKKRFLSMIWKRLFAKKWKYKKITIHNNWSEKECWSKEERKIDIIKKRWRQKLTCQQVFETTENTSQISCWRNSRKWHT